MPENAEIIGERRRIEPWQKVIRVTAFDETEARVQVQQKIGAIARIDDIRLDILGEKGFLGIGRRPSVYEAKVSHPAVVELMFKREAKVQIQTRSLEPVSESNAPHPALPPDNKLLGGATNSSPLDEDERDVEAVISCAREVLLQDGPAGALEYLRDSSHAGAASVVRMMHALVYVHYRKLPKSLLAQPFFDPIYCQCSICEHTWVDLHLQSSTPASQIGTTNSGLECSSCGRVLCPECARAADTHCRCGGSFLAQRHPNGRKRREQSTIESEEDDWIRRLPDRPLEAIEDLHLYFGYEGRVPIGVDATLPIVQTANAESHLEWAEMLLDVGQYYQAQQQLDLLAEPEGSSARANWLRARLELIQLHNAAERDRHELPDELGIPKWREWPTRIKLRLGTAIKQSPRFGPVWLTAAQIYLDPICGQNFAGALECSQRARALLDETPAVLLALGQALRGLGRSSEAVTALRRIPSEAEEQALAQQELALAELEERCLSEPVDVEAHLNLGRSYIRHEQRDRARAIYARLLDLCPDRAEGYYGLARLAFTDFNKSMTERLTEAHQLCREAIARDPEFGLAHELLGSIFANLSYSSQTEVGFPKEDPFDYYRRAIQYDRTCDQALCRLAEHFIANGELQPALELLEQAAALDTNDAWAYYVLAAIYGGNRDFEKEAKAAGKAKQLRPDIGLSAGYKDRILELCGFEY